MPVFQNIVGNKYGLLRVESRAENGKCGLVRWNCICECGGRTISFANGLKSGGVTSCGCKRNTTLAKGKYARTHGMHGTKEYDAYYHMRQRCYIKSCSQYKNYGGRGIKVCDRWLENFENFFEDVGKCPSGLHSVDRIDSEGNYEPGNVRWATQKTQQQNRNNNFRINYNGEEKSLAEWCEILSLDYQLIWQRLQKLNWTPERAFNEKRRY